ncbi:uncharacterized protein FTOL_13353 [Fusarium torulosum]|uniref:Uncharacterized protein n=1 Tax=Fusarium torulosum TaxID=33205 RepID=A0AAE8SQ34_9HYPO|nr:uncharacterized protein FTOL_13353 [Fusarium torulosum]
MDIFSSNHVIIITDRRSSADSAEQTPLPHRPYTTPLSTGPPFYQAKNKEDHEK